MSLITILRSIFSGYVLIFLNTDLYKEQGQCQRWFPPSFHLEFKLSAQRSVSSALPTVHICLSFPQLEPQKQTSYLFPYYRVLLQSQLIFEVLNHKPTSVSESTNFGNP